MIKAVRLVVFLVVLLSLFMSTVVPVYAAGVTVDADIGDIANFIHSQVRLSCYAEGRYWVFYPESGNILYNTSLDGSTWDGAKDTSLNVAGTYYPDSRGMAIYAEGSYVHLARSTDNHKISYIRILLDSDGNITLGTDYVAVNHPSSYQTLLYPSIAVSTDGLPYITYAYHDGGSSQLYVSKSSVGDGVWSTASGYPLRLSTGFISATWFGSLVPLASGRMLAVFGGSSTYPYVYARSYSGTGTTWNSLVQSTGQCGYNAYLSTVSVGDVAYISYLRMSPYTVQFLTYTYSTNSFSAEQTLSTGANAGMPVIAYTPDGVLRVYWIYSNAVWGVASVAGSGGAAWSGVFELMAETIDDSRAIHVDANPYAVPWGIYYVGTGDVLKIAVDSGEYTVGSPFGVAIDATDITAYSATLNAVCTWDGGGNTTAVFMWGCPVQDGNVTYDGYVTSGEYFSGNATSLIPSQTYGFWVVLTNEYGEHWSNLIYFNTEAEAGYSYPLVVTYPNNPAIGDVGETSAKLYGYLSYDGNLDCQVGFQYRVDGASTWITGWNSGVYHTAMQIRGVLSSLQKNTTYEYRAVAQNAMSLPGDPSYGVTLEFTTSYYAPAPTGGTGIGDIIPESIKHYFENWSPMLKMVLALVITIGGMALLAAKLPRAKAGGLAVAAYGGLATIGFIIAGWYPTWVLILLGAVVGLLLLLTVLGGRK